MKNHQKAPSDRGNGAKCAKSADVGGVAPFAQPWMVDALSRCTDCRTRERCIPAGLSVDEEARLKKLVNSNVRIQRGEYLFRAGGEAASLYVVGNGSFKSSVMESGGREQIVGFYLPGEFLGVEGIGTGTHECDVIALEDSAVCSVRFSALERLSREIPALGRSVNCLIGREITRSYRMIMLLGSMGAEERLAAFLLNLSHRLHARGYSPKQFLLRMARHEIGSYLGLKLETVSRAFSHFMHEAIVEAHGKDVRLADIEKLKAIVAAVEPSLVPHFPAPGVAPASSGV
jgi:CRP/FNR family transcriptional regulator